MTKIYFPERYVDVSAETSHGEGAAYRVSAGFEHWGGGPPRKVFKVQMVYGDAVAGRKAPSFPQDTDDLDRVLDALRRIRAG